VRPGCHTRLYRKDDEYNDADDIDDNNGYDGEGGERQGYLSRLKRKNLTSLLSMERQMIRASKPVA